MTDYSSVTEAPGVKVTPEAARMLHTRYGYAANLCHDKDVLEVACGSGMGLGYLARRAHRLIGGDCTESLLSRAQAHYGKRVPLVRLDAHALPFKDSSFDVVILFEAIYYLAHPQEFLNECYRVLRQDGVLLLCTANKEWKGFNPSPHSRRYFCVYEIHELLSECGFHPQIFGAFPAECPTIRDKVVACVRTAAVRLRLIPKTMSGKQSLKRFFYGSLVSLAPEVADGDTKPETLRLLSPMEPAVGYKVLYALGRRNATNSPAPGSVSLHSVERSVLPGRQ